MSILIQWWTVPGEALQAQGQLNELLARYTETHPEVVAVRRRLEALRQRRDEEIEAVRKMEEPRQLGPLPKAPVPSAPSVMPVAATLPRG